MNAEINESRILVPLDGSALAERALPIAERLARATGATLALARVVPTTTWAFAVPDGLTPPDAYQQLLEGEERVAIEYLEHLAERLRTGRLNVQIFVLRGEPATTIIDLEQRVQAAYVVMATHGRSGMARFALGSVADRLVRGGHAPVLLVRPFGTEQYGERMERVLVPLDGSPLAELALPALMPLVGRVIHQITLAQVVDADTHCTDEASRARGYLEDLRARLEKQLADRGCTVRCAVLRGAAAEEIVQVAQQDCDLITMTTRGHSGARRWAFGSVADRVLHGTYVPLLLIHPPVVS